MADLLGQIANPQMADIAGALDYRQKKIQEDEQRRKDLQFNQIAGKALSSGLREGSMLQQLASTDPAKYIMFTKTLGIDPANGAEGMSMADDIGAIYNHSLTGAQDGVAYVDSLIKTRGAMGLDTKRLQDLKKMGEENPTMFGNVVGSLHKSLNGKQLEPYTLSTGQERRDANNQVIAKNVDPLEQAKLDLERKKLELENKKLAGGGLEAKEIQQIQKDVSGLIQPVQDTYKAARSMESLKGSSSPLAMQAAIIQFNKALDPGSVVRTEEGKIVSDSGGAMQGLIAKYNSMVGQGKLTPEVMNDIVNTAKLISDSAVDSSSQQISDYLAPYGQTLPEDMKSKLAARVPKKFGSAEKTAIPATPSTVTPNAPSAQSLDDLVNKYAK